MKIIDKIKCLYANPVLLMTTVVLLSFIIFIPLDKPETPEQAYATTPSTSAHPKPETPNQKPETPETQPWEATVDTIPLIASKLIPHLLNPQPNASIRHLSTEEHAALSPTTTPPASLDALWVEFPPLPKTLPAETFTAETLTPFLSYLKPTGHLICDFNARTLNTTRLLNRIHALRQHFTHIQLWMTGQNRWQIVGSATPIQTELEAITALLDQPGITEPLLQHNIPSPIFLLSSCYTADATTLQIEGEGNLNAPCDGRYMIQDFIACYDPAMPWVKTPQDDENIYDKIIIAMREGRRLAYAKEFTQALKHNQHDPYLLGLADHERLHATYLMKVGMVDAALASYNRSFSYAEPSLPSILEAADAALASGDPTRAKPYYELASTFPKDNPAYPLYLRKHLHYLEATGDKLTAESTAIQLAMATEDPVERRYYQFEAARIISTLPQRADEGIERAKRVLLQTPDGPERQHRIQAYADLMKNTYRIQEGIKTSLYFKQHGTLIPESEIPEAIRKIRRKN